MVGPDILYAKRERKRATLSLSLYSLAAEAMKIVVILRRQKQDEVKQYDRSDHDPKCQ